MTSQYQAQETERVTVDAQPLVAMDGGYRNSGTGLRRRAFGEIHTHGPRVSAAEVAA
ncbi:hypothetical protein [Actinosynnema sp. ALI-1.44]|uniref:hypothetical protein n=1 Tax=Actinosynnema sp. ALI-1.44 TaxID=1933779 RepID=UPI0018751104|nr:hypothetical protein [Actinosynnema sp. ALI-1.44]